jgi:hypothetical protein
MQTYHASSGYSSTDEIPYFSNKWLSFSFTYTYFGGKRVWMTIAGFGEMPEIYEVNYLEYAKKLTRPFVLGEAQYEGERTTGDSLAGAGIMRRQACWSVLSGSCGAAYGSWNWKVPDNWRQVEEDSGAGDMGIYRKFFESFDWYRLVPDIEGTIIKAGKGTFGKTNYATAAITPGRDRIVIYLPPTNIAKRTLTVDVSRLKVPYTARWFNPANGAYQVINTQTRSNKGEQAFTTPGDNGGGYNDWVLVLQTGK